jgi:hypothetical protein
MDDDIRESVQELGKHIQAVGRILSSPKSNTASIELMREALLTGADTLDQILEVQQSRYVYDKV